VLRRLRKHATSARPGLLPPCQVFLRSQILRNGREGLPERRRSEPWNGKGTAQLTDSMQRWSTHTTSPSIRPSSVPTRPSTRAAPWRTGALDSSCCQCPLYSRPRACGAGHSRAFGTIQRPSARVPSGVMSWSCSLSSPSPQSPIANLRSSRSPNTSSASSYGCRLQSLQSANSSR
jgi:hypothetical protein